ncbi:MAG: hypothetical protein OXH65_05130 [Paracoccaceae bacterium]|nr:hypothetical protein [Paracoccaceae bacterium]
MAKQDEVKKQLGKHVVIAVSKVIQNPKNSKAARTAAGLGLAHRRNNVFWKSRIQLPAN